MDILRLCITFFLFFVSFQISFCYEDEDDTLLNEGRRSGPPRVDADVKRPYRACQGFEDPEEVDCYLRSDVKKYVCTEPASFNPCESEVRITTYHYDHIKHRCEKVNVPACSGQIIRALSLIQCLIYCHNNDPFALGKSTSMIFKLNQKKPYVVKDEEVEERERAISFVNDENLKSNANDYEVNKKTSNSKRETKQDIKKSSKKEIVDKRDNKDTQIFSDKKTEVKLTKNESIKNVKEKSITDKANVLSLKKTSNDDIKKKSEEENQIHNKEIEKKNNLQKNVKKESKDTKEVEKKGSQIKELKTIEKKESEVVPQAKTLINNDKKAKDLKDIIKKEPAKEPQLKLVNIDDNKEKNIVSKKEPEEVKSVSINNKKENDIIFKKEPEEVKSVSIDNKKESDIISKKETEEVKSVSIDDKKESDIVSKKESEEVKSVSIDDKKENNVDSKSEPEDVKSVIEKENVIKEEKEITTLQEVPSLIGEMKDKKSMDTLFQEINNAKNAHKKKIKSIKAEMYKKENELLEQLNVDDKNEKKEELFTETEPTLKEHAELIKKTLEKTLEVKETPDLNHENKREIEFIDEENNLIKKDVHQGDMNENDKILHSDSKDKGADDGFYLWDE